MVGVDVGICCVCGLVVGDDVFGVLLFVCMDGGCWEGEVDEFWVLLMGVFVGGEVVGLGCLVVFLGFFLVVGVLFVRERLLSVGGVGFVIVIGGREEGEGDVVCEYCYWLLFVV